MSNEVKAFKPYVRDSILEDCLELSENMRQEDREEIWIASRSDPLDCLVHGIVNSTFCKTVVYQERVVAMFGVTTLDNQTGLPWMLATDELKSIKKSFLTECKKYVDTMLSVRPYLTNFVYTKNSVHILWLRWLGFTFKEPAPIGVDGELFMQFEMRYTNV
jgi:hypothetical protein